MEVASRRGYTEDASIHQMVPTAYLQIAQKAVTRLRWPIVILNDNSLICHTLNYDFSVSEIITITAKDKRVTVQSSSANEYLWDEAQNTQNVVRYKHAVAQIIQEQGNADRNIHPMHREKYGALLPSKTYLVTPLIVYVNVFVFIAMVFGGVSPLHPMAQTLLQWGGNFEPAVIHGQWWRLLSYMFLHAGVMHLLMNSYALLYIGMFLEPLLGKFRFASAYILTGICAGLLSITMHTTSVGVGASGAIFGMYGIFLSVLTTSHIEKTMRKTMLRSILFFVVLNLLYGLQGNTDNAAHIGGLLSGMAIGYLYYPGMKKQNAFKKQLLTTVMLTAAVVLLAAVRIAL